MGGFQPPPAPIAVGAEARASRSTAPLAGLEIRPRPALQGDWPKVVTGSVRTGGKDSDHTCSLPGEEPPAVRSSLHDTPSADAHG
ncbi:hypothetical protein NDU88_001104 [Pleurodeles waltl]|uniref:Uncharacterized protein n=1 Tax=Pleurodeles waltl TaxID=8319 RepID=A0AAV7P653_PLEWA|nr:hypothetical protein NDU88_001104 [Pleurodeles waltl]